MSPQTKATVAGRRRARANDASATSVQRYGPAAGELSGYRYSTLDAGCLHPPDYPQITQMVILCVYLC